MSKTIMIADDPATMLMSAKAILVEPAALLQPVRQPLPGA
jgi:hypothetical protein